MTRERKSRETEKEKKVMGQRAHAIKKVHGTLAYGKKHSFHLCHFNEFDFEHGLFPLAHGKLNEKCQLFSVTSDRERKKNTTSFH